VADESRFEGEDEPQPDDMFGGEFSPFEGEPDRPEGEEIFDKKVDEKEVKVMGVYEHRQGTAQPQAFFVVLRDNRGRSVLIWIGRFEAVAISVALEGAAADRPMTHDLLKNIIDRFGGKIDRIVIDDLFHDTYYAKIAVQVDGRTMDIDSRPSDAIALALRAKAPIYMAETVLEQAAVYEDY
jgi:bifunctional DNase/RNase